MVLVLVGRLPDRRTSLSRTKTGGYRLGQACGVEGRALGGGGNQGAWNTDPSRRLAPGPGEGGVEAPSRFWESAAWGT